MNEFASRTPIKTLNISTLTGHTSLKAHGSGLILMLEGQISVYMDGQSFTAAADDLICFYAGAILELTAIHGAMTQPRMIIVTYETAFTQKYISHWDALPAYIPKSQDGPLTYIRRLLMKLASAYYRQDSHRELNLMCLTFEIMHQLAIRFDDKLGDGSMADKQDRTQQIQRYLQNNYDRSVTLVELADTLHISSAYLSRYIKEHMQMGFQEYLRSIRTEHAVKDLLSTSDAITSIALNNGFPNVAALNKQFKEVYGMTPNQYRRTHNETDTTDSGGLIADEHPLEILNDSSIQPVDALPSDFPGAKAVTLKINLTPDSCGQLNCAWNDMINIGFGIHCSEIRFQNQLADLLDKIHFKYGRIQGIFKDMAPIYERSPGLYPLPNLDIIFDFLNRVRLLPHIDFAYISQSFTPADSPQNFELIRRFLKYYMKRYGQSVVAAWRFEYSMPRLNDQSTPALTPKAYAANFNKLGAMLHALIPDARLGGFGCSPLFTWSINQSILQALNDEGAKPDYISLHLCPYEPSPDIPREYPVLTSSHQFFKDYIRKLKEILCACHYDHLPLLVTSLKNELGSGAYANDSAYMAPFLFKTYCAIYSQVDGIAYTTFSDIALENPEENPYFSGGSGIITPHHIRKPSWFSLFMLAKASPRILHHSEHCFITSMDAYSCQILMYNFVPYTDAYCLNNHKKYPLPQTYQCFASGQDLTFIFDCSKWPGGPYRLQKFRMGRDCGSALDEYMRLGIRDDMLPIELDYLKGRANLNIEVEYPVFDENTELSITLKPMDIAVFVLYLIT